MNLRHVQYTDNPVKDRSLQQKQEGGSICAYPNSSTKEDTQHTGSDLTGANQQVGASNHLQLAVFSNTHIQIHTH